jgi:hypothetical protein
MLQPPQVTDIMENHVSRTYQGLVTNRGDEVIVLGWPTHGTEAIATKQRGNF